MFKNSLTFTLTILCFSFFSLAQTPTLVINEVSNGASGTKEYFEFLVDGPKTNPCQAPVTLDLRDWIIDDNNGFFGSGSNKGIATGAFRFKNIAFWSAVPVGTLIVIYNNADYESSLIHDDISLTDGNCKLVIPCTSNLLEAQTTTPTPSSSSYPASGWATPTNWAAVGLRNDGDGVLILRPTNTGTPIHSLAYGDVNVSVANIGFSGTGSGMVYAMNNTHSDNFNDVSNWKKDNASSTTQTPGLPNNPANNTYILSLSNGCQLAPTTIPNVALTIGQPTTCNQANGILNSTVTGGTQPYTYTWSNGAGSQNIENVPSGNYTLIVTDASGCKDTSNILLPTSVGPSVTTNTTPDSCDLNVGTATVNVTNGLQPYTYTWSNGATTSSLTNVSAGNYTVEIKDANNCVMTTSVTIAENTCPQNPNPIDILPSILEMPNVFTPNADGKNDEYIPVFQQNITLKSFTILNRWGNVMYENDVEIKWDGKVHGSDAVSGTYFYLVRYTTHLNEEKTLHGFFHLVR